MQQHPRRNAARRIKTIPINDAERQRHRRLRLSIRRARDRLGESCSEAGKQSLIGRGVVRIQLGQRDPNEARAGCQYLQCAEHLVELEADVAGRVLGQRCVSEVDYVDIEMDGVAVRTGSEQIERAACGGLRIRPDLVDRNEAQAELVIRRRSNFVDRERSWPISTI